MRVTPLLVTATVTRPAIVPMGGPNLGALLAWARSEEIGAPSPHQRPVQIDIPLACLWRDADGWPLWAATDLYPIGEATESRQWLHRRYPSHRAELGAKLKVNLAAGPYKEKRLPAIATVCTTWRGAALATDPAEVERLINTVPAIGSRTSAGFGSVHEWRVEPFDGDEDFILARRSVPIASGLRDGDAVLMPWTPPYWHAGLWSNCVRAAPCF